MSDVVADKLRSFADRVEDGEIEIVEISVRNDPIQVTLEGMNADELKRLRTVVEEDMRKE